MKRKPHVVLMSLLVLAIVAVVSLSSCASYVRIDSLVPAEIDLGAYRNLAVSSTKSFSFNAFSRPSPWVRSMGAGNISVASGISRNLETQVASFSTDRLMDTLQRTGFFSLIPPAVTDAYLAGASAGVDAFALLRQSGATALLNSAVNYMDCDEYVYSKARTKWIPEGQSTDTEGNIVFVPGHEVIEGYDYYLVQTATVTFSYSIVDLQTGMVIAARSFSDKQTHEVKLGGSSGFAPTITPLFTNMISAFQDSIRSQVAPSVVSRNISLMGNKPKNAFAKEAYKEVDRGNIRSAYTMFLSQWQEVRHVPSGYNAALLLESSGDNDGAIALMEGVYAASGNSQVWKELERMRLSRDERRQAESQLGMSTSTQEGDGSVTITRTVSGE
ncbi:MAG: hypothetical protein ACOX6K_11195 [Sphaerochaetaceae bacterium]|jgi:hypothetical protein